MKTKINIPPELRLDLLRHVEKTLALSNKRPAQEITNALLSSARANEHFVNITTAVGPIKNKKLLEIGSGFGLFLTIALKNGVNAVGLEPSKNRSYELTNKISKRLLSDSGYPTSRVKKGFGEKIPFNDNSFDIVCSFYTLEHVHNVEKVFRESVRVLKPGGYIFFEVPNYGSFWEGHYGIFWIPYLSKRLSKIYVKLWGKEGKLVDELQFVTPIMLKRISKKLPIEILDLGKGSFCKKMDTMQFTKVGTLGSATKILFFLRKLKILRVISRIICVFNAQTPILFVAIKNDK